MTRAVPRLDARWAIVAVGFVALSLAFSGRSMLSLAMEEWVREFGWTKAGISGVMTATLVIMAGLAPLVGYAIDRSGPRIILAGGLLMVGASSAVLAGMHSMLAFIIGFAVLGALGFGLVATHAVSSAVARSFDVGQGRAVGIATSGSTAGQFVFMPILGLVLAGGGWRLGYEALAAACLIVAIIAWWLLRNAAAGAVPRAASEGTHEGFITRVGYLLRRPAFHGLFWSFLLCGYTSTGVVETHLIPFAQFCGIPPAPSALAFGILMGVNTLGMVAAGYLTDRMNRTVLLASIYFFRSLTFLMLPLLIQETAILWIFAFLFGVFDYATVPPTASLAASHLGKARVGTAMGLISAGHAIGAALGAFAGGYLFDLTGGYTWLWSSSFGLALAAAMIAGLVPARSRTPALA
ncbi:MFS transporter [Dongia deserti]|uniref:MFS transporter n=1 Tax=Dongia deserti TaxID=2268030 RepID=UPI000E6502A0|nr:MFS transporter [Dongia deserti]